jgi:ketosteroid isomerase-like protein
MSQENVEIVGQIYEEGLLSRDPERLLELATPDVEYVNPPEPVEAGTRRGQAEVARALRFYSDTLRPRIDVLELFDGGDVVVASVLFRTQGRGSQSELVQEGAHIWTLREGKVARFEWGRDLSAALEAAGLRE